MGGSITIARVWGIDIRLHWTLVFVFALLVWSLAGAYLPVEYPGMGATARIVVGVVAAVLFLASILLHELGHAWMARREGVPVNRITLFIFGGVAEIGEQARTPGAEFRIAAGGPVVSLILAIVFQAITLAARGNIYIDAPAHWLARINLLLLLFNLVPGYPLDGGRLLRAAVWHFSGSEQTGWKVARASGQIVAFALIGWGVLTMLTGGFADGIWLVLIGWFLQNAVAAETASATLQRQLAGATVQQAMGLTDEPSAPSRTKIRQLVDDYVLGAGQSVFLVVDDGVPRGVVTLADLKRVPRDKWDWTSIADVMTPWSRLTRVEPQTGLLDALRLMDAGGFGQLPVVEGGRLVGLLTREEILRFLRMRTEVGA
jgi:Zn-dependent protease/CBS domain-containing protein